MRAIETALPLESVVEREPAQPARARLWRLLALIAVALAAVLHIVVAASATAPSFPFDEITILGLSKLVSGVGEVTPIEGAGYFPGWSVVLAPLWWFTQDAQTLYQAAIWLGVAFSLATIWPMAAIARELGLTTHQAVTAAALVMTMPSRALQADYVMSERLLLLLFAWSVAVAFALWRRPGYGRVVLFAVLIAMTYFSHARAMPIVLVGLIWLVLFLLRQWRVAVVGIVVLAVLGYLAHVGAGALNALVVEGDFRQNEGFLNNLEQTRPSLVLRVALGQAWYQVVATGGIVVVGAIAVVVGSWRDLRARAVAGSAFLFGSVFAMSALSIVAWSGEHNLYFNEWRRLDAWIYGRYLDPFTAVVMLVALAALVLVVRRAIVWWAIGLSGIVMSLVVFWVAPGAPTWGFITPAHIPGVMPWAWALPDAATWDADGVVPSLTNDNRFWLLASLSTLLVLLVVLALRRRPALVVIVTLALFSVGSLIADRASNEFQEREGRRPAMLDAIAEISGPDEFDAEVVFDRECRTPIANMAVAQNYLVYWFHPIEVELAYPSQGPMEADLVISCADWPLADELGAIGVPGAADWGSQLWVLPGQLQDELIDRGVLPD